jgi:hypothetical protein
MNKKRVFVLRAILLLFIFSIFLIFFVFNRIVRTCNDGTTYNQCSSINPYFCSRGDLIENASFCGCSDFSKIDENRCFSNYQLNAKNITLNYTIRGEESYIEFIVYEKLSNYLSGLSRYNSYDPSDDSALLNFRLKSLDNKEQRELLLPLVIKIQSLTENKDDQARIAVSVVQNIPFGNSNKKIRFGGVSIDYYRYPYEVLYDLEGVCGEKSALLVFLLREMGYGSSFIYYPLENHEVTGISCPEKSSLNNSGYCFIETTGPSIISDYKTEYLGIQRLSSTPKIIPLPGNITFGENNFYEFRDFKILDRIRERMRNYGTINFIQHLQFQEMERKYGLEKFIAYTF